MPEDGQKLLCWNGMFIIASIIIKTETIDQHKKMARGTGLKRRIYNNIYNYQDEKESYD